MRSVVVLTGPEMQAGILREVQSRPSLKGKFVGAVHLIADPLEQKAELRIRAQVVLFDTEGAARAYAQGNPKPVGMENRTDEFVPIAAAAETQPEPGANG